MKIIARTAALAFLASTTLLAQQFASVPGQGRSMVVTKFGIVAAPQFLASQAGAHILEEGGNAIDAAIAANAVMGVVQPYVNGMGGDLFALYYDAKTGKLYGLNSSGWTPKALTIDYLKSHHIDSIDPIGVHSIDIPGAVAGWQALKDRFGTMPFSKTLAPAIYYAQNGFPLAERNARYWVSKRDMQQPGYKETYLPGGVAPQLGDLFQQSRARQLAATGCGARQRCVLQRPHDRYHGQVSAFPGRHAHTRRLRGLSTGVGRANLHYLSRMDCLRVAAERSRGCRALHAEHHGAVPHGEVRT